MGCEASRPPASTLPDAPNRVGSSEDRTVDEEDPKPLAMKVALAKITGGAAELHLFNKELGDDEVITLAAALETTPPTLRRSHFTATKSASWESNT